MTKCEAYENLKDYLDNVFHNSNDYETYCYLRDCADTLAPPAPDPITGLMPCGCGGKAHDMPQMHRRSAVPCGCGGKAVFDEWYGECVVRCSACGMSTGTFSNNEKAKAEWNRAMGWKGGAE